MMKIKLFLAAAQLPQFFYALKLTRSRRID